MGQIGGEDGCDIGEELCVEKLLGESLLGESLLGEYEGEDIVRLEDWEILMTYRQVRREVEFAYLGCM